MEVELPNSESEPIPVRRANPSASTTASPNLSADSMVFGIASTPSPTTPLGCRRRRPRSPLLSNPFQGIPSTSSSTSRRRSIPVSWRSRASTTRAPRGVPMSELSVIWAIEDLDKENLAGQKISKVTETYLGDDVRGPRIFYPPSVVAEAFVRTRRAYVQRLMSKHGHIK